MIIFRKLFDVAFRNKSPIPAQFKLHFMRWNSIKIRVAMFSSRVLLLFFSSCVPLIHAHRHTIALLPLNFYLKPYIIVLNLFRFFFFCALFGFSRLSYFFFLR